MKFRFPSVLLNFVTSSGFSPQSRKSWFSLGSNRRDGFTKLISAKVKIEILLAKPTPIDPEKLFQIIPNNLVYNGMLFNVNEQAVLNNDGHLTASTHSADTYYGFGFETYKYKASKPSATAYAKAVNKKDYVQISETNTPWKYNTWRRESVYIIPE